MIDGVPVADTEKFAASPDNFDRGSRWRILEPLIAALEPKCEDPSLVDPTTSKNLEGKQLSTEKDVIKMNYQNKFKRAKFEIEALQPYINYIKKPIVDKNILLSNIQFIKNIDSTKIHNRQNGYVPSDQIFHQREVYWPFQKKKWRQYINMRAKLDCAGDKTKDGLGYKLNPFKPQGIEQHLFLYIFQGLHPTPQLIMKTR